ncbi:MAG TPA: hypothetical protein VFG04_04070 [Planctomycetaceae bacterium]|jgi:hypothetical protein|nr:hypothetical protein [Planctomycetaceae bacterium]
MGLFGGSLLRGPSGDSYARDPKPVGKIVVPGKPEINQFLLALKEKIVTHFNESHWQHLGLLTNCEDVVNKHHRLLRSLRFGDDDYEAHVIAVLRAMLEADPQNLNRIASYVEKKFQDDGEYVSSMPSERKILFAPNVFKVPEGDRQSDLVAVMMPFVGYDRVYAAIKDACEQAGFNCLRADDIWEDSTFVQDIFTLIFRSHIVVADFSQRNPNVLYETGIAHCLGRTVVPITRDIEDVPSDLRHHRACVYLPNSEGLAELKTELAKRLSSLVP